MFGAHIPELLIVLVLALVVFGPKRLPEIGGALGKSIREFRDGTSDMKDKMTGHETKSHGDPAQIPGHSLNHHDVPVSPMPNDDVAASSASREHDAHPR